MILENMPPRKGKRSANQDVPAIKADLANAISHTSFSGQRHVVSTARMWRETRPFDLSLAGNRDVLAAAGMGAAFPGRRRNRAGDLRRVDPMIRRGLCEIPRLAIGAGGVRATPVAVGQALIDAIAIRLVGDDERPAVRKRCGGGTEQEAGIQRGKRSHQSPDRQEDRSISDKPVVLKMINQGENVAATANGLPR